MRELLEEIRGGFAASGRFCEGLEYRSVAEELAVSVRVCGESHDGVGVDVHVSTQPFGLQILLGSGRCLSSLAHARVFAPEWRPGVPGGLLRGFRLGEDPMADVGGGGAVEGLCPFGARGRADCGAPGPEEPVGSVAPGGFFEAAAERGVLDGRRDGGVPGLVGRRRLGRGLGLEHLGGHPVQCAEELVDDDGVEAQVVVLP